MIDKLILEYNESLKKLEQIGIDSTELSTNFKDNNTFKKWFENQSNLFFDYGKFEYKFPILRNSPIISNLDLWRISSFGKQFLSDLMPSNSLLHTVKLGRCNYPFNPVFYANNSITGALFEVFKESFKPNEPKNIILSKWQLKDEHDLALFSSKEKSKNEDFNRLYLKFYNEVKNKFSTDDFEKLGDYLGEIFLNPDDYTGSAFLAQNFLYSPLPDYNSAIIFPSVRNTKSFNVAINRHITDNPNRFVLIEAYDIEILEFIFDENGNGHHKYKCNNLLTTKDQCNLISEVVEFPDRIFENEIKEFDIVIN